MAIEPSILIFFGTTGDLAKRKVLPALWNLYKDSKLPEEFVVLGVGRSDFTTETYRNDLIQSAVPNASKQFLNQFHYLKGDITTDTLYDALEEKIRTLTTPHNIPSNNIVYYYSIPPRFFKPVTEHLAERGLSSKRTNTAYPRVAFEKPFGTDIESAEELNKAVREGFAENHIFRVDHYLAKSAINNLLTFRFSNSIFESLFSKEHVDHIQVTLAESLGVGQRAGYYDSSGALRDMVQSHLLQTLALLLMEPPASMNASHIHMEKSKLLSTMYVDQNESYTAVRGQYQSGKIDGAPVKAYRDEQNIDPESMTETYTAMKLKINNWRWSGTPIYIRTGKRLPAKVSSIRVVFTHPPCALFCDDKFHVRDNELRVRIQPDEEIALCFNTKKPETGREIQPVKMHFSHEETFGGNTPAAYEQIMYELLRGDKTLFAHWNEVHESWRIIQPLLDNPPPLTMYEAGSWGPDEAQAMIEHDGREWRNEDPRR